MDTKKLESLRYRPKEPETTGNPEAHDYGEVDSVVITAQHAMSLGVLVQHFKGMIISGVLPEVPGRSDELTSAYCDELLEDLKL